MRFRRKTIVLDAAELEPVSAFWAGLLDGQVDRDDDWHTVMVDGDPYLAVQLAPNHVRPEWPDGAQQQQIHFDLVVDDLAQADQQAIAAGATLVQRAEDPSADSGFQVYADPAGHLFCLCWE
jgi:predicted enzyme related to lactoylglutathione lyase